jgi:hypothetical protein
VTRKTPNHPQFQLLHSTTTTFILPESERRMRGCFVIVARKEIKVVFALEGSWWAPSQDAQIKWYQSFLSTAK